MKIGKQKCALNLPCKNPVFGSGTAEFLLSMRFFYVMVVGLDLFYLKRFEDLEKIEKIYKKN